MASHKWCNNCSVRMVKNGRFRGKQRYFCPQCSGSIVKTRLDTSMRNIKVLFKHWLLGKRSLSELAREQGVARATLSRRFHTLFLTPLHPRLPKPVPVWSNGSDALQACSSACDFLPSPHPATSTSSNPCVVVVDGIHINSCDVLLTAYDVTHHKILSWYWCKVENYSNWYSFLSSFVTCDVTAVVSDGQKGLQKALDSAFPCIPHQRCMAHVIRLGLGMLTKNPTTDAGKDLRKLITQLPCIHTSQTKRRWIGRYKRWKESYSQFLAQKSFVSLGSEKSRSSSLVTRWWYTHRNLRAVRSLLTNAIPGLFYYTQDDRIPRTSNDVEGGINSQLTELLRLHRGLRPYQQRYLVAQYLTKRMEGRVKKK